LENNKLVPQGLYIFNHFPVARELFSTAYVVASKQTDVNEIETIKKLNSKKKTIILARLTNMVSKKTKKVNSDYLLKYYLFKNILK
jgi:hypothetical protein